MKSLPQRLFARNVKTNPVEACRARTDPTTVETRSPMQHRTYSYKIQYLGDAGERGREWCTVTVHGNGDRTLRALCEMDDSQVLRDVTSTVDAHWRPKDVFVRV